MSRRNRPAPSRAQTPDPWAVLGLARSATATEIDEARRRLAKTAHPDVGGSVSAMQRVNAAADAALLDVTPTPPVAGPDAPAPPPPGRMWRDHPSFTIEALPAEAFEALLVVASWLGEVIDDDPPYSLEVALNEPLWAWCRLTLVPDAGSSTVSLAVVGHDGLPGPALDQVRDAWIDALNHLDWDDPGGSPQQP